LSLIDKVQFTEAIRSKHLSNSDQVAPNRILLLN
jgi:hypothetical protein